MEQNWKVKRLVSEFIEALAISPVTRFYPTALAKYANIPLNQAFKFLLDYSQSGELKLLWEVRCSNPDCVRTLELNDQEAPVRDIFCNACGEEFEVSRHDIFPTFEISKDFKKYIRDEKKKKFQPHLELLTVNL